MQLKNGSDFIRGKMSHPDNTKPPFQNKQKSYKSWFAHSLQSRLDLRMAEFFGKHGAIGYGIFWLIIETLYQESAHRMANDGKNILLLANYSKVSTKHLKVIIDDLCDLDLLCRDDHHIWSNKVDAEVHKRGQIDKNISKKRAQAGAVGAAKRWSKEWQTIANDGKHGYITDITDITDNNIKSARAILPFSDLKFPPNLDSPAGRDALQEWLDYKASRGQRYKSSKFVQKLLDRWAALPVEQFVEAVNWSISSNYAGLFQGPANKGDKGKSKQTFQDALNEIAGY